MKNYIKILLAAAVVSFAVSCGKEEPKIPDTSLKFPEAVRTSYTNPISTQSLPDPTVIRGEDGIFYLYATEDIRNMPVMASKNLIDWVQAGIVFRDNTRPNDVVGASFWAPDITKQGDKYVLYYSIAPADLGNNWQWGIGTLTSDSPMGPWSNTGKLFLSGEIGVRCSIDPFYFEDGDKKYMVWGSYFGLWAVELAEDGLSVKPGAKKTRLVGTDGYGIEGAMVHFKDGYYYFFASEGGSGYDNDYKIGVVRSKNFLGPYENKAGQSAIGNGLTMILKSNEGFQSPGHCSGIITDDKGNDWLLYHSYVKEESDNGRRLMLDKITWEADGWPSINGGNGPTATSTETPYFK